MVLADTEISECSIQTMLWHGKDNFSELQMIVLFVNVFTTIYKLAKSLSSRILAPPNPVPFLLGDAFFVI